MRNAHRKTTVRFTMMLATCTLLLSAVTTNPLIEVDGDTATVEAFFMEVISNGPNLPQGSNPPTIWAMGRYMDDLVKIDEHWFFQRRTVITDMNEKFEP